ncbi:MAG TPA: molybdate ABC transporter substrate-binding protein [Candidatus Limnocylindria bacterium]|nr:molybdate ABC transporter substrate-binding protein [Candidatus Limnocylindria bacterium]
MGRPPARTARLIVAGITLVALLPLACAPAPPAASGSITVYAATSLVDVFEEIGSRFEATHPGTAVSFNFEASATLAAQINDGAAADVFAPASESAMAAVADTGRVAGSRQFASNSLVIATPVGSEMIETMADLAGPGVRIVLASNDVAAGQYARQAIRRAAASGSMGSDFEQQVLANVVAEEQSTQAVLAAAQDGHADAVIVYVTDALAAGETIRSLPIPEEFNLVARYPIGVVAGSVSGSLANAFTDFVLSAEGQAILASHGFGPPVAASP